MAGPTEFPIRLWHRTHEDGSVTVAVVGEDLALWGLEVPPLVEELELAMSDRIERSHPRLLERFAAASASTVHLIEVDEALIAFGPRTDEGELPRLPTRFTVVETLRGDWRELWLPRLEARVWVGPEADATVEATALVTTLLGRHNALERLPLRYTGPERVEVLQVVATPAPLGSFVGPESRDMLPEPTEAEPEALPRRPDGKRPPPTPTLDEIASPLHKLAKAGRLPRAYEREPDIVRLLDLLSGRSGPIVVLGPRGVGKTALLDELACRVTADDAPLALRGRPAFFLDADRLVAGDGFFGDWQRQVLDVLQDLLASEAIWFLGAVLPLLDAGKSAFSQSNVAQMLGPALATRELRVVAESSEADWALLRLRNPGFAGLFVPIRIAEPAPAVTERIVDRVADEARKRGVTIDAGGRKAVVGMARRYGRRDSLLGASVGLLRRVIASAEADGAGGEAVVVDQYRVVHHVCEETGLPAFLVRDDVPLDRDALRARFAARILGQNAVIDRMADLIVRIKAGLADQSRPLGAYLFLGPTGVGKTETVKALAEVLYGRSDRILRFDMSEYGGSDALDRLMGQGPTHGLVGRVAQLPFAVVLLDEIEKAHPAVFDLLLQVLGEARLSDASGRLADFRNSIVLMTSNLGVGTFRLPTGFGANAKLALRDHLLAEVRRFFRPEFVGRLDEVIAFEPLGAEPIAALTHRELDIVRGRDGFVGRDIGLHLHAEVPGWLAARGVDLRYGARPLKRTIERALVAPVAKHLSERTGAPRAIAVGVAEEGQHLEVSSSEVASDIAARDAALREALDTLSHLRYSLRRWSEVPPLREARHLVRLVDRLADTRIFWRDEAAARERLTAVEGPRAIVVAHAALLEQVEALEDLVLESWAERRNDAVALLPEVATAQRTLTDLAWATAGLGRPVRDEMTIWFAAADRKGTHDQHSMEPLVLAYARVATRHGCKLRVATRTRLEWDVPDAVDAAAIEGEKYYWRAHDKEIEDPGAVSRWIRSQQRGHTVVELALTGPHIATMLLDEAGLHTLDSPDGPADVLVVTWASAGDPDIQRLRLLRPPFPTKRQRQILVQRDRLRDFVLGRMTGIGRLDEQLETLLRDRMLARMFR